MAPLITQLKLYAYFILLCTLRTGGLHESFAAPIDDQTQNAKTCINSSLLISLIHNNASCSGPEASAVIPSKQYEFLLNACKLKLDNVSLTPSTCALGKLGLDLCTNSDTLISKTPWLTNDTTCRAHLQNWCNSSVAMPHQESMQGQVKEQEPCVRICESAPSEASASSGSPTLCDIVNTMSDLFQAREEHLKLTNLNPAHDIPSNIAKTNSSNAGYLKLSDEGDVVAPNGTEVSKSPATNKTAATAEVPPNVDTEMRQNTSSQSLPLAESDLHSTQIKQDEIKGNISASDMTKPVNEPQLSNRTGEISPAKAGTPAGEVPGIVSPVNPDSDLGQGNSEDQYHGDRNNDLKVPKISVNNQLESSSGSSQNPAQSKVTGVLAENANAVTDNEGEEIPIPSDEKQPDPYSDYGEDDKRVGEPDPMPMPDTNENTNAKAGSDPVQKEPVSQTQPQAPQEGGITFLGPTDDDESESGYIGYFITLVGFFGICFLLLHNKKRILAFVIEGRRPNPGRRRSTTSYRKLENNFD